MSKKDIAKKAVSNGKGGPGMQKVLGTVGDTVLDTISGIKDKVVGRAKDLFNKRKKMQENWEKRPNNKNYYGGALDFKDK
jgi:Ca2+-dependent lipid-binding protein